MVMEARRTTKAAAPVAPVPWTRVDLDRYAITSGGEVTGYVEVVGPVFVALAGPRYDRAVEVAQSLTFHAAVDALVAHRR